MVSVLKEAVDCQRMAFRVGISHSSCLSQNHFQFPLPGSCIFWHGIRCMDCLSLCRVFIPCLPSCLAQLVSQLWLQHKRSSSPCFCFIRIYPQKILWALISKLACWCFWRSGVPSKYGCSFGMEEWSFPLLTFYRQHSQNSSVALAHFSVNVFRKSGTQVKLLGAYTSPLLCSGIKSCLGSSLRWLLKTAKVRR